MKRILLLGATGRTGKIALTYALAKGYEVNCLVRDSSKISAQENLYVFEGTPANKEDLANALQGCKTVVNILNISRTNDFPWAPLRTPPTLLSNTTQDLLELSQNNSLDRIVSCSAWGVGDSRTEIPRWFKWTIQYSNIAKAYRDHERQESLLMDFSLNYTIIRPTGLINSGKEMRVKESFNGTPKPSLLISRKATAQFLIDALEREDLNRRTVTISKD